LLTAKIHIPPLRPDYISRPQLVARLHAGLSRKLTLVSTPAGFGKTTLLCEWLGQHPQATAWVSLDKEDNDHGRFITYVMAALQTLDIGLDQHIQAISQSATQGVPLEPQMAALMNDFSNLPASCGSFILVLDDYHVIHNPAIHASMGFALDFLPENLHLVIATRTDPPLPFPRLRARHQLNELRAQDLRFTRAETESFLRQVGGLTLSPENIEALDDRTEGWVAGLQLATLAMSGRSDIDRFVRAFTGSNRYILDYLVDEVISRQSEEIQEFLLRTSILERMTAGLCDSVTGKKNGRRILDQLERENLFVVSLDPQRQWYRYHHLFSDLLKSRLELLSTNEISGLHRNAAIWYESHDQPYGAISHALEAKDYNLAIDMMVKATPILAMRSEISILMKWLNEFPADMRMTNPRIPLMYAWANFFNTDIEAVEPHIQDALHALGLKDGDTKKWPDDLPLDAREMLAQVNALRTFVAVNRGEPERGIRIGSNALAQLPKEEKLSRFALLAAMGDAYRDADNFAAASQAYSEALAISEVIIDQYAAGLTMRMDLARLRVKMGQLRHAEAICREVLASAGEELHPLFPLAQAYSLLGDILRERNDLPEAEKLLSSSIKQCEWAGYQRYLVFSHISMAKLRSAQGEHGAMASSLQAAEQAAAKSGSEPLRNWACQFRYRLLKRATESWLEEHRISPDMEVAFPYEDETLTLVRLHLEQARHAGIHHLQVAYNCLERLLGLAQKSARTGSAIEILLLESLVLKQLGKPEEALFKLRQSLTLAEPEGYVRLFTDEGDAVAELLVLAVQHNIQPEYATRLLAVIQAEKPKSTTSGLAEPLTEREGEVLRLLAVGLSNQEIAEKLVISLSTIKTHITRIYGKLDVTSRTQAILRAQELKII
jgi:LuxR family transcriptional regulator, maltose regulon positive regulatory protein